MENPSFSLSKHLAFAKIVSTPTLSSWSQAYNAGNLFAVLSLHKENEGGQLAMLGKEILDTLEQEFFTLETKNFESIKKAVATTWEKIPNDVSASLVVASIQTQENTILYVFGLGKGRVLLKRREKIGSVLVSEEDLVGSSGFLQDQDIVILQTRKFANIISHETLALALDHFSPAEIAETLAPKIHPADLARGGANGENAEACAIIISYKIPENEEEQTVPTPSPQPEMREKAKLKSYLVLLEKRVSSLFARTANLSPRLNHSKKLFLTIAVTLLLVLVISVIFALKNEQDKKRETLFREIYGKAEQKYDQGQSLLPLNKNLARDDFEQAKQLLVLGKTKFKKDSKEAKRIEEFLKKIDKLLVASLEIKTVTPKTVDVKVSSLLALELKNPASRFFSQDAKNVYFVTNNGVSSVDKKSIKTTVLIKNQNLWSEVGGFGVYLDNVYVLDKKTSQILKFVAFEEGYNKTNYLATGTSLALFNAQSLSINGYLWVLLKNGTVLKFNRGKLENFAVLNLNKPFSNPSRIFTAIDSNNLYILDNGNSRIVIVRKDGTYQAQYQANILKNARDFEVLESSKKIFVLSQNKVYEIGIK